MTCVTAALLLAGCADPQGLQPTRTLTDPRALAGTGFDQPAPPPPAAADATASPSPAPWPTTHWWTAFGDPALSALVEQALADQPSLQQVLARARQAATRVDAVQAGSQPQAALTAELSDQRFSAKGAIPPALAGATRWNNSVQLGARWSLDLFGRQRAALDAAVGQQRAAEADAQAARVLLAAEVARRWFALAHQLDLQDLAAQALGQRLQVQALVRQRITAGLDNAADGLQADARVTQALQARQRQAEVALVQALGGGYLAPDTGADLRAQASPADPPAQPAPRIPTSR